MGIRMTFPDNSATSVPTADGCSGFQSISAITRRSALRAGSAFGIGLTLPELLRRRANAATAGGSFGRVRGVIMLYLHGGHPQQETFDPKPNGPSAVKGEFGAISTSLPGVQFSELLPRSATIAEQMAIIRSMSHDNPNHVTASLPAGTGHKHPPGTPQTDFPPAASDFPAFGAVLDHLRPATGSLPSWVRLGPLMRRSNGTTLHGQLPGFLGARHGHFAVDQKLLKEDVRIEAIEPSTELTASRVGSRQSLLREIDGQRQSIDNSASAANLDTFYQRAFSLLSSPATRRAFDLADEPRSLRDTYGWTEFGQRCVLARRLIEAGVPMVNVSYCHTPSGSWDTHSGNFKKMKESLAPTLDAALHGLFTDLKERGLLDETLVVVNAEFGRTPTINKNAGRDHWPWVYSLALAGAGIRPGTIYGASDNSAAYPAESPRTQADFAATLYHLLGIPPDTVLHDQTERPHQLVTGQPVLEILS
tara:strand:+ start:485203 stop:486633 length:1431 start_codon:yes stop_codon:yes gene_type:complete